MIILNPFYGSSRFYDPVFDNTIFVLSNFYVQEWNAEIKIVTTTTMATSARANLVELGTTNKYF